MNDAKRVYELGVEFYNSLREFFGEAVAKGTRFLDAEVPNWREIVDADLLDLTDACACILGQLDADYSAFLERTDRSEAWAVEHGFNIPADIAGYGESMATTAFEFLTDCWHDSIGDR